MEDILAYIERIKQENERDRIGPRTMAQEPRNMAQGGRIRFFKGESVIKSHGDELVELVEAGESAVSIAKKFKVDKKTVNAAIRAIEEGLTKYKFSKPFKDILKLKVNITDKNLKDPDYIKILQERINDSKYKNHNMADLVKDGIITDRESRIPGLKAQFEGKHSDVPLNKQNIIRSKKIKIAQASAGEQAVLLNKELETEFVTNQNKALREELKNNPKKTITKIRNNPLLMEQLTTRFNPGTGVFEVEKITDKKITQLIENGMYSTEHTSTIKDVARNVEYPINRSLVVRRANVKIMKNMDTWFNKSENWKNFEDPKVKAAKKFLDKHSLRIKIKNMPGYFGAELTGTAREILETQNKKIGVTATQTKALDLSTAEGRLLNKQQGTVKILNKILENNKIYEFSELAKEDPAGFLKAVKEHELASKILNKPGLVKGALRGLSGWIKKESGPFGWVGSIATIDAAFGLHAYGQGKTPLQALDTTFWFLPKWVFKADEKMFENVYKKAGFTDEDFGEFQKWMKLEDLDQQYFMSEKKLKFMQGQVLEGPKTKLEEGLRKEMDQYKDSPYAKMGWMNPMFAITSEEAEKGEHRHYGFAVDEHNRILTESRDVFESLKDEKKSRKDLDYSRKLAVMEEANRKKQMQLQGWQVYGLGDKATEEMLYRAGKSDLLYPEYVHPIEGPSVSAEQMRAAGFAGGGLTRTVAPDSGPMSQGLRSLYIDDRDY